MDTKVKHLAIIMDGNSRWAKINKVAKSEGYVHGMQNVKKIVSSALDLNIPYLTLFSFSAENWNRSQQDITQLINLLNEGLSSEAENLQSQNIRLKVIGRLQNLPADTILQIEQLVTATSNNTKMTLCIAFSYGGREEIIDACQKIIDSNYKQVDEKLFKQNLYDNEMPDVDLLIRTSGEQRISNFLLWHLSYAELYFTNKFWPDFTRADIELAINDYLNRKRNFGHARE